MLKIYKRKIVNLYRALQNQIIKRIVIPYNIGKKNIINFFHILYHSSNNETHRNTYWLGIPVIKCPLDLWMLQEIIYNTKPDVIIECGTYKGGSALFLATICDLINNGKIITIDIIDRIDKPQHKRIQYMVGSSTSEKIIKTIKDHLSGITSVMLILDSSHRKEHVLNELRIYSKFITKGSYIIVEDTNFNAHPIHPGFGPGPMEAVEEFLSENKNFIIDKTKEKFLMTFNPKGFLKRIL